MSRDVRRMIWRAVALAGHALVVAAFLWLPWARGRGALAGQDFTGPELARLARNTDIVLGNRAGGPAAVLLVLALYAVPVAALTAAVLLAGAHWTHSPSAAVTASACFALLPLVVALIAWGVLAADFGQRPVLAGGVSVGMGLAQLGALLAIAGSAGVMHHDRSLAGKAV